MEHTNDELVVVAAVVDHSLELDFRQLTDLQLASVGGGHGDVTLL